MTASYQVASLVLVTMGLAWLYTRRQTSSVQGSWVAAGLAAALPALALLLISSSPRQAFEDFGSAYYVAAVAVRSSPDALLPILQRGIEGFVNLPIVAYAFVPFTAVDAHTAAILFTACGLASVAMAVWLLVRLTGAQSRALAAILFIVCSSGPLMYSVKEGNLSHFTLPLIVGALATLRKGRGLLAGTLLGVAALIKLPLLLFGVYFALRRRWPVVAGGALTFGAAALISVAIFGWDMHVIWYEQCVRPFSVDAIPAYNVQSIAAFAARLEYGGPALLVSSPQRVGTLARAVVLMSTGALYLLPMLAAVRRVNHFHRAPSALSAHALECEFLLVLVLACISSPLSWAHYYCWLLVPAAYFIAGAWQPLVTRTQTTFWWVAVVLITLPVRYVELDSARLTEFHARTTASALLFSGVLMLGLLTWGRWITVSELPVGPAAGGAPSR